MSRLQKDSTILSVASTSQEGQENRTLKVTLLSNEWKSSTDGELSTINRELAIQLAKHPNVDVSVLLPSCSREDRSSAKSHNVKLIEAQRVSGVEPVLWLLSPPRNHTMDCVIGHGVHLGRLITPIKRNPNYCHCKWIQVVYSAPEEDGMYRNISEGQKKQETEIQLCKMADQVVTIGPKLAEAYKRYLRPSKQGENVFDLTPSIFSEFLEKEQATEERQTFYVLVIGSGDSCEDFTVKGYDIAAKAITELKDESYKLRFVCAPGGKGDQTAEKLLQHGVSRNQLLVRSFNDSREVLANLFCEVDLAIMPSRTDGFGITALEAISAGLPILVSSNSGLGEALKKVSLGSQCVVDSEDPKDWAREIKRVRQKEREVRLSESRSLRKKYMKKYSWEEPCRRLVNKMYELTFGLSESGTIFPISDKRPTPFVAADQPSKRLREELIHSTHHELQGAEVPSVGHLPQSSMEYEQFSVSKVAVSKNKPTDQRSFTQSLNRYPPSEHCQSPFAGASSTYCAGPEHQRSHPQGSSSSSSPAHVHVAVDHTQGSLSEAFVNQNYHGSQNYPQSHNRHPSSEHSQNPYAGASSMYYGGFVNQECHPQGSSSYGLPAPVAVDYSQGNHPAALLNPSHQGSQTLPQSQNRQPSSENDQNPYAGASSMHYSGLFYQGYHPWGHNRHSSPKHGQNPYAGASSRYYGGFRHQECYPQGSSSYGLPAPVAVDYCQGNHPAAFLNPNNQGSQTFPQSQNRKASSENDQDPYAGASSTHHSGPFYQGYHPQGSDHCLVVEHLRDEYMRRSNVKPLMWDSEIQLPIDDVYTRLQIKWRKKACFQLTEEEVHMYEIFKPAKEGEKGARMVLVEGNPGIGKTTFCLKIARDWAKKSVPVEFHFPVFQLLFLLKCCDIHKDTKDIVQAIEEQLLNDDMKNREDFLEYIRDGENHDKILLILDGLDELPEASVNVVVKLFRRKIFSRCFILVTSREEKGIDLRERYDFHTLLQIKGFTSKDAADYIRKHFKSVDPQNLSKGERLIQAVEENIYLGALRNNPLNLLLLCVVFEDFEGKLPSNRTKLYQIIFRCLLRRYCSRSGLDVHRNADKALENQFKESILVLGELAWKCLLEDRRSFSEEELDKLEYSRTHVRNFPVIKLGLIFMEASSRPSQEPRHQCHFLHKTFQEFLAAFYLKDKILMNQLNLTLGKQDVCVKFREVFYFVAGILGMDGTVFFKQIGTILRQDWDWHNPYEDCKFLLDLLEESGAADDLGKVACPLIPLPNDLKLGMRERSSLKFIRYAYEGAIGGGDLAPVQLTTLSLRNLQSFSRENVSDFHRILESSETLTELVISNIENMSHDIADLFAESVSSSTSLRKVTLKLFDVITERCTKIVTTLLPTFSQFECVALEFFGDLNNTAAQAVKVLLKTSLKSLALIVYGNLNDCLVSSVSEGLGEETELESLSLVIYGRPSNPGIVALQKGVLRNRTLHSLELRVYGEIPEAWMTAVATILAANKSWKSLIIHPNVCGKIKHEERLLHYPILGDAPSEKSLTMNVCGELSVDSFKALGGFFMKSSPLSGLQLNIRGKLCNDVVDCLVDYFLVANNSLSSHSIINLCGEITSYGGTALQRLVKEGQKYAISVYVDGLSEDNFSRGFDTSGNFSSVSASFLGDGKATNRDEVFNLLSSASLRTLNLTVNHANETGEWALDVGNGLANSRSLTTFSLTVNSHADKMGDWAMHVGEGLANSSSLTTFSLTVINHADERGNWADSVGEGLAKSRSLTTFSLTVINHADDIGYWAKGVGEGLAKSRSLTTFSLTVINNADYIGYWANGVGEGLAKSRSLTTFSLTVINHAYDIGYWADLVVKGLAKSRSLTTFSLTVINHADDVGAWVMYMGEGLANSSSLTTFSLTVNGHADIGLWANGVGEGLAKSRSLTTFSLTVNDHAHGIGYLADCVVKGLAKSRSLTTFSLTVINHADERGHWADSVGEGLAKSRSLTTFSLTVINHADNMGNWAKGVGEALAKSRSLTTFSLTVINHADDIGNWADGVGEGLAKSRSLTTFSLTVINHADEMGNWANRVGEGLAKSRSLTRFSLTVIDHSGETGHWANDLSKGLAKNRFLTTINVAFNLCGEDRIF